jgi:hypothetical protein
MKCCFLPTLSFQVCLMDLEPVASTLTVTVPPLKVLVAADVPALTFDAFCSLKGWLLAAVC